jgi:hypothetical protein
MNIETLRQNCNLVEAGSHRVLADSRDRWLVVSRYGLDLGTEHGALEKVGQDATGIAQEYATELSEGCINCKFHNYCHPTPSFLVLGKSSIPKVYPSLVTKVGNDTEYINPGNQSDINDK